MPETPKRESLLGVVLAGGRSRRFGRDKALFPLLGKPMAAWAIEALEPWTVRQGVIANNPEVSVSLGIPMRPDRVAGLGPLGGLWTALEWAEAEGLGGIALLACDMPLVDGSVIGEILQAWPEDASAVVPESSGPLGFEPLCGAYDLEVLEALDLRGDRKDLSMKGLLSTLPVHRLSVRGRGQADASTSVFTNVNTVTDARRIETLLRRRMAVGARVRSEARG